MTPEELDFIDNTLRMDDEVPPAALSVLSGALAALCPSTTPHSPQGRFSARQCLAHSYIGINSLVSA
jgi:hypothetical protein